MLSRVSSDLRAFLSSDGVVGRFGGDEFLIVYLKSTAYEDVHAFFMRMYQSGGVLRKTIELDDLSLFVTGTLGNAFYPGDAVEFDDLFARIDKALYRGKSKGRNCFIMYVAAKHDQLRIPTLSKRSLYETFRAMAEGFDSADEVRLKLFHAFQPLRDNLHLNRLLCLSRDGRLTDAENGMLIEMTGCMDDSMPQGVYAVSDLNDMKRRCHALYGALTGLGLESVMVSQVTGTDEDYACLLLCPEAHTKRIWQDDEYATAFILSRMLSQFLERQHNTGADR